MHAKEAPGHRAHKPGGQNAAITAAERKELADSGLSRLGTSLARGAFCKLPPCEKQRCRIP